jgi:negative regulator of genetic competence, sporulation and motility
MNTKQDRNFPYDKAKQKEGKQSKLFDTPETLEDSHWVGMPEYKHTVEPPYQTIIVRFATEADLIEFTKCINQKITPKTKSIWYPKRQPLNLEAWEYVDENYTVLE